MCYYQLLDLIPPMMSLSSIMFPLLQVLIEAGANVNVQNQWGHTPLMEAVRYNNKDAAVRLLEAGCDVNLRDYKSGDTALHVAVRKNYTIIVDQVRARVFIS